MALENMFSTADNVVREFMSTGLSPLDEMLGGGLVVGLLHLLYGNPCLHDDILRFAVTAAMPRTDGGPSSPTIIIDSMNMIDTNRIADLASIAGLQPEDVFDMVHVSRAFNSCQTYDLVVNHVKSFVQSKRARLLLLPGLVDIFVRENLDAVKLQQVSHMAATVMHLALNHGVACVVSSLGCANSGIPRVGQSMLSFSQIHLFVEQTPMRIVYSMTKHPYLAEQSTERVKERPGYLVTVPLDEFL